MRCIQGSCSTGVEAAAAGWAVCWRVSRQCLLWRDVSMCVAMVDMGWRAGRRQGARMLCVYSKVAWVPWREWEV